MRDGDDLTKLVAAWKMDYWRDRALKAEAHASELRREGVKDLDDLAMAHVILAQLKAAEAKLEQAERERDEARNALVAIAGSDLSWDVRVHAQDVLDGTYREDGRSYPPVTMWAASALPPRGRKS